MNPVSGTIHLALDLACNRGIGIQWSLGELAHLQQRITIQSIYVGI